MKFIIRIISLLIAFSNGYTQEQLKLIATMTGEENGDIFSVVAGVGDINKDGYDDLLVGAPGGNYARLYFGGSPFDTLNFLKLVPDQAFTFGESVAGGGDLNGDGFPDFIIGAPQSSVFDPEYYSNAGKVFVYLGGSPISNKPYLVLKGAGWRYDFGRSVAFAGDVNNDGYDDIIIGAPFGSREYGSAYIYFGGVNMDSVADVLIEGQESLDMLGWSVSGAGDVNKDGFDDVIIGAPQDLKGESGKAYLFYGGNEIGFENSKIFLDEDVPAYGSFGRVVAGLSDINNDGFDDFGVMGLDKINIYLGNVTIDSIADFSLLPDRDFGYLRGLGDLNKDGFDDIVAVSKYVNIFFGNTYFDTIPDISLSFWATPVCGLGDINGDSYAEIGFGRGGGWDPTGKVYIYSYSIEDKIEEKKDENYPEEFKLNQNYPNPFNSSTTISYHLSIPCSVRLEIFNYLANRIKTLVLEKQNPGCYNVTWNGKDFNDQDVASGIYLAKLTVEYLNEARCHLFKTQKLVLIR